jgi:hypothetical protein
MRLCSTVLSYILFLKTLSLILNDVTCFLHILFSSNLYFILFSFSVFRSYVLHQISSTVGTACVSLWFRVQLIPEQFLSLTFIYYAALSIGINNPTARVLQPRLTVVRLKSRLQQIINKVDNT